MQTMLHPATSRLASSSAPTVSGNHVLDRLPRGLRLAAMRAGRTALLMPGAEIETGSGGNLIFPLSGIVSIRVSAGGDPGLEVAMVGREGVVTVQALPGSGSAFRTIATTSGAIFRLDMARLPENTQAELLGCAPMVHSQREVVLQMAYAALAGGRRTVPERLARWLLMVFDRIDEEGLAIHHLALAAILGVRRPGVSEALAELEGTGAIRARRGQVHLRDRQRLIAASRGCYGALKGEDAEPREHEAIKEPMRSQARGLPPSARTRGASPALPTPARIVDQPVSCPEPDRA